MMKAILMNAVLLIFCSSILANEAELTNNSKYVSINIEIKELNQAGAILKEATTQLSTALEDVSQNLDQLSPEQLMLINALADKTERITEQLNLAINNIPNTIQQAQKPTSDLLHQSLEQIKEATIKPVVSKLETWLIVTIIGLCVLAIGFFIACAYCMQQVGKLGSSLKDIADGYRIIPVEEYRTEVLEKKPQTE